MSEVKKVPKVYLIIVVIVAVLIFLLPRAIQGYEWWVLESQGQKLQASLPGWEQTEKSHFGTLAFETLDDELETQSGKVRFVKELQGSIQAGAFLKPENLLKELRHVPKRAFGVSDQRPAVREKEKLNGLPERSGQYPSDDFGYKKGAGQSILDAFRGREIRLWMKGCQCGEAATLVKFDALGLLVRRYKTAPLEFYPWHGIHSISLEER